MPEDRSSPGGTSTGNSPASTSSTSSQSERGSSKEFGIQNGRPQTPQHRRGHSEPQNAFSPTSPPKLPSPMTLSFYRLGIGSSPLSPFRRQFSSHFSNNSASPVTTKDRVADADDELSERDSGSRDLDSEGDDEDDDDLTQDSKDVLVDRLNDLLKRVSTGSLGGANINTLHAKVDEMEKVLASDHHQKPARPDKVQQRPSILQLASPPIMKSDRRPRTPEQPNHPDYWGFSRTPPRRPLAPAFLELSTHDDISEEPPVEDYQAQEADEDEEVELSSEVADSLLIEAEKLCLELNAVVQNLQDRREESDHIHEMLVDRAEAAAKRIMELDDYVSVLEDEISTNRSDLEHLRHQLRALEVICYEYVPPDADRDLLQSIENWKSDYTRLKLEMASRRRERNPLLSAAASPSAPSMLSPSTSLLMERAGLF